MRRPTIPLLTSAICLALVLSACSAESDAETTPTQASSADTKDPSGPKGGATGDDATDDGADTAGLGPNEGAACLVGTWLVDPQSVIDVTIASAELSNGGVEMNPQVTVTGDGLMTYAADGRVTTAYREQVVEMTAAVEGTELRSYGRTQGSLVASYTATDTEITTFDGDASGVEIESETTVDGEPFDVGDLTEMTLASWELGSTSSYICSGDKLEITPVATGFDSSLFTTHYTRQ